MPSSLSSICPKCGAQRRPALFADLMVCDACQAKAFGIGADGVVLVPPSRSGGVDGLPAPASPGSRGGGASMADDVRDWDVEPLTADQRLARNRELLMQMGRLPDRLWPVVPARPEILRRSFWTCRQLELTL